MTSLQHHSDSPLKLESYHFLNFQCHASQQENADGALQLTTKREVYFSEENPRKADVVLTITYSPAEEENVTTYQGEITVSGRFEIIEGFAEGKREALIRVTASSILYGAARELLANFTARSVHGVLSLPSISFRNPKQQESDKKEC